MIVEFIKRVIRFLTYLSIVAIVIYVIMGIIGFTFFEAVLIIFSVPLGLIIGFFLAYIIEWAFDI
jgi:hypothetical protein